MIFPTIHLNGTSKEELFRQYEEAYAAINVALEKMVAASPNGRDYYIQSKEAFPQATAEHRARVQALHQIADDIFKIMEHINQ